MALLLRALFVALAVQTPLSDAERYLEQARRLLAGLGYTNDAGLPTAYTPPGYPLFIAGTQALLGTGTRVIAWVQAFLGALTCAGAFLICRRLFDRRSAVVAGLLLALSPTGLTYAREPLSEVPTTLGIVGALLLLVPQPSESALPARGLVRPFAAGCLLGAAMLCRPAILAWSAGLGVYLWLLRPGAGIRRIAPGAIFALGVVLVVGPWIYRNHRVFHSWVPIATNGGYDLFLGNNPRAWSGGWMPLEEETDLRDRGDEIGGNREAARRATAWMRAHPGAYAVISLRRGLSWISVVPDPVPAIRLTSNAAIDAENVRAFHQQLVTGRSTRHSPEYARVMRLNWALLTLWSFVTIPLALVGIFANLAHRPRWLLLAPFFAYAATLSLTFMQARFREVAMPVLLIYAGVGACGLPDIGRQWRESGPRAKAVLLLGAGALLVFGLQVLRDLGTLRAALGA